ncbi:MAG: hypothetical protein FWD62_13300 [Betaproteobacteria bacterium]|nr:hypothetical protein [Betaproteobacteria bacterium]
MNEHLYWPRNVLKRIKTKGMSRQKVVAATLAVLNLNGCKKLPQPLCEFAWIEIRHKLCKEVLPVRRIFPMPKAIIDNESRKVVTASTKNLPPIIQEKERKPISSWLAMEKLRELLAVMAILCP